MALHSCRGCKAPSLHPQPPASACSSHAYEPGSQCCHPLAAGVGTGPDGDPGSGRGCANGRQVMFMQPSQQCRKDPTAVRET
jgi:hypothetical protein